jgi:hypothetical protein
VYWHDDGSLTSTTRDALTQCFPGLHIISRVDADARMASQLANRPHCEAYRSKLPLGLKVFDVPYLGDTERFILLDTDLLFFERPKAILEWVDSGDDSCWFNEDVAEPAAIAYADATSRYGIELWHRVNSGLCLLTRNAFDFDLFEQWIQDADITAGHPWRVEQTLYALGASKHARGGLLSSQYEITIEGDRRPDSVVRHYVGIVRDLFYSEGIRTLCKKLVP